MELHLCNDGQMKTQVNYGEVKVGEETFEVKKEIRPSLESTIQELNRTFAA